MSGGVPDSLLSLSLWFTRIISTILCVRSSSERMPVSSIMEGRTVTGGTGRTCSMNHSGLAVAGSYPSSTRSSLVICANRPRSVIGSSLCSPSSVFSEKDVGLVNMRSYWILPQCGHSFAFRALSIISSGIFFWEITVYAAFLLRITSNCSRSACGTLRREHDLQVDISSL